MFKPIYNSFHAHYHRRYHGFYAHAKQLFVFDICLLVLAIGMLTTGLVFFFWKPSIVEQIEFHITLGESRVLSGQVVPITISYTNHSKVTLKHVVLTYKFPPGFILDTTSLPQGYVVQNNSLALPDVPPGANGEVQLGGRLWTDVNAHDSIVAVLSYTQNDATEKELKISRFFIHLPGSVVTLQVHAPTSTLANVVIPVTTLLKNTSDEPLLDLALSCSPSFTTTSTNPLTLTPGSEIRTYGTSRLQNSGTLACSVTHRVNGSLLTISHDEQPIVVVRPEVRINATIDTSASYATPGSRIPLTVLWRNVGHIPLANQKITINFTPGVVDIAATAAANTITALGDAVVIDTSRRTSLGNGAPGSSDSFSITLVLRKNFTAPGTVTAFTVTPVFTATTPGVVDGAYTQFGQSASLHLPAELSMTSEVRYFTDEGDQLGRGPLPPRVGQVTKYWVLVTLMNKFSDVTNASFTATLPSNVTFTGNQSPTAGPSLSWHPTQRTVYWSMPRMTAGSSVGIYFEVAVTPADTSVDHTLPLTGPLSFTATDSVTGQSLSTSNAAKTNVLGPNDKGSAKGATVHE